VLETHETKVSRKASRREGGARWHAVRRRYSGTTPRPLGAGDLDGIVEDYSDDAVIITPDGVKRGKDGIREAFTMLLADVPNADWALPTQIYDGDVLFLEWTATSAATKVEDGIDTFIFRDGQIRLQTVRYTLQHTH
jgi:hypothetical protein